MVSHISLCLHCSDVWEQQDAKHFDIIDTSTRSKVKHWITVNNLSKDIYRMFTDATE